MQPSPIPVPARLESRLAIGLFLVLLGFQVWGTWIFGWNNKSLPGVEFRQAQTALSAYWIKENNDFSLAYPTPVLGKPWSIPMEFPLYQWTVVATSKLTGLGLTKAGRAVSIVCFYLCLPAVFLLLARWQVAPGRRWLVLAVLVSCPLYIFYGRAFLVETMALMFALWFWVAYERAVSQRSPAWLALAMLAGVGASLVKVTTLIVYLIPAALWSVQRLWAERRGGWRRDFLWMAAAVALPVAAAGWWVRYSDAVKALNPVAYFLSSAALRGWNFGTNETRFSLEFWRLKGVLVRDSLTSMSALAFCAVLAVTVGRHRWKQMLLCLGTFGVVLALFPVLYAVHEYYYVSNALLLCMAMGLALVALAESPIRRGVLGLAAIFVTGMQLWTYAGHYYPTQREHVVPGSGLTEVLRAFTRPREVLVTAGLDWSSITPYYSQRPALMLLQEMETNYPLIEKALHNLEGEKIGALVIFGDLGRRQGLIDRLAQLGLEREPLLTWYEYSVFFPRDRHAELLRRLQEESFERVEVARGVVPLPAEPPLTGWHDYADLTPRQRGMFNSVEPHPERFYSQFGMWVTHKRRIPQLSGHPETRLVFRLKAGRHTLRSYVFMPFDSYRMDLRSDDATDGVEITLSTSNPSGEEEILYRRLFDPRHNREDRGDERPLEIEFELSRDAEVELVFGPGANGRTTRDWIQVGPIKID